MGKGAPLQSFFGEDTIAPKPPATSTHDVHHFVLFCVGVLPPLFSVPRVVVAVLSLESEHKKGLAYQTYA